MDDRFILDVINNLKSKYNCHSIIFYGSYVTGEFTHESDLDVICFTDGYYNQNDNHILNNVQLDAWIYNTNEMDDPRKFLHIRNGKLLLDQRNLGGDSS